MLWIVTRNYELKSLGFVIYEFVVLTLRPRKQSTIECTEVILVLLRLLGGA